MIKDLNKEISDYFKGRKASKVIQLSMGPKVNLWKAVKVAKSQCPTDIPLNLTLGGVTVSLNEVAGSFAEFFSNKVKVNVAKCRVNNEGLYNGNCKLIVQNRHFMKTSDVWGCLPDLNGKKCEGFDRIPVCAIYVLLALDCFYI